MSRWLAAAGGLAALACAVYAVLLVLYPFPFRSDVGRAAVAAGVDPHLVVAVMRNESRFNPASTSRRDARGLMQVVPETGAWIAAQRGQSAAFAPGELYRPAVSISYGTWYLGSLERDFGGRTVEALAAYNAGQARVQEWLESGTWSGRARDLGRIPFPETRSFVYRVLRDWRVYRLLYPRV